MSQVLIEESRYIELLKYEARFKKQAAEPKKNINNELILQSIKKGIADFPLHGENKTYDQVIKPFFIELYGDRAGLRSRQKAWKDGIEKLTADGIISVDPCHSGMSVITLVTVAP